MRDILPELNGKEYIEKLNENYEIRFLRTDEYEKLKEFIDTYWRKDHIFVLSKQMFDFQHLNITQDRYDFVVAEHRQSKEIHSILGFITTKHFDEDIAHLEVWPAIWKTRDDIKVKGLGVGLYYYLKEHLDIDNLSILGISSIALSIYKHWNLQTGKICHYVYPNQNVKNYVLADGLEKIETRRKTSDTLKLRKLSLQEYEAINESERVFQDLNRYKSKNYYINRYYKHPLYQYLFFAIGDEETKAIMVARECGFDTHWCLRIVDFIGDIAFLKDVNTQLSELMNEESYEYIDLVEVGLKDEDLKKAQFANKAEFEEMVVPNYFEPFDKRNVDLDYAFRSLCDDEPVFFKADSDQDRPNLLSR